MPIGCGKDVLDPAPHLGIAPADVLSQDSPMIRPQVAHEPTLGRLTLGSELGRKALEPRLDFGPRHALAGGPGPEQRGAEEKEDQPEHRGRRVTSEPSSVLSRKPMSDFTTGGRSALSPFAPSVGRVLGPLGNHEYVPA